MNAWPRNWALKAVVGIWSFPTMALSFLFVILPLLIARQLESRGWRDGAWDLVTRPGSWMRRKYAGKWGGFSQGWCVVYLDDDDYKNQQTRDHERVHLAQQLILGVFQWVFYIQFSVVVWLACRTLHAYKANPFELDARRRAGESIANLGPEPDGDRWPWW